MKATGHVVVFDDNYDKAASHAEQIVRSFVPEMYRVEITLTTKAIQDFANGVLAWETTVEWEVVS